MAFRVELTPEAFTDLDSIADYLISEAGFRVAGRWFNGIFGAIRSLATMPSRYPVARESAVLGQQVHVLAYGRKNRAYRVYFSISLRSPSNGTVHVLHIRHWARRSIELRELEERLRSRRTP